MENITSSHAPVTDFPPLLEYEHLEDVPRVKMIAHVIGCVACYALIKWKYKVTNAARISTRI